MRKTNRKDEIAKNQNANITEVDNSREDIYSINTGAANRLNYKNEPTILLDAEDNLEMLEKPTREKISIWKKREGAKLKDMKGMDKVKYIFAYYYQWMVVAAIVIFIIYVACFVVHRTSLNTRLNVVVLNATESNVHGYLEEVVPEYYGFGKKDQVLVDTSITLANTSTQTEASTEAEAGESETEAITYSVTDTVEIAARMKATSMSLAGTLDIIIAEEDMFTGFVCEAGMVLDLLEFMPDDIYELVEEDLIYGINANGEEKAIAIKIPEEFADNLGLSYEPYVSIGCTSKNYDEAINFIRMIYGLEYVPVEVEE